MGIAKPIKNPFMGLLMVWIFLVGGTEALASNTMLMFVGEDLEVLTIASRKEEAAWSAPAIASVVAREEIWQAGTDTVSKALEDRPGFHMNHTEKGSTPYLRGIPYSVLFLFDTVPMGSGITKSEQNIDYQTSLAPVKRIEIVRGTGSVLWGADAFAGVVNVVPLSGREFQGVETGVIISSSDVPGEAYMNWGKRSGTWSSFLSVSGRSSAYDDESFNTVKFWSGGSGPESPVTRYGFGSLEDSHYINLYGSLSFREWLNLSVGLADNKNAYVVSDWDEDYSWEEQTGNSGGMCKLEAVKRLGRDNGVRFTGYHTWNSQNLFFIDNQFETQESSWYGEMIYDHSLFNSSGLFTLGTSFRLDDFNDIPVWKGYLPDFLGPENAYFLPEVRRINVENSLKSVFTQYRHNFGNIEAWVGIRYDDHEEFEDKNSYNSGVAWNLGDFIFKAICGTAYRKPSARQLLEVGGDSLEKIRNFSAQLSWRRQDTRAALTLFNNRIDNHVNQDRYAGAGLSTPNSQTINGVEIEFSHSFTPSLSISGSMTFLDNTGADETYLYNDYTYIDPNGNSVRHFETLEYAYDSGPKRMGSLKAVWKMTDHLILLPELNYFSKKNIILPCTG